MLTLLMKGTKAAFPKEVQPMLATLIDKPFDKPGWIYEIKWDGYRALAFLDGEGVKIKSRNNKSFDKKFYPVHNSLKELNIHAVTDGEIIVVNEKGVSDFSALQGWRSEADGELMYYIFDLLWLDNYDITLLPLCDRKKLLRQILPSENIIRLSENFQSPGKEFFTTVRKLGFEGVIAKQEKSFYYPGIRSEDWVKIKMKKRQEAVIGGYTKNENTKRFFSSLLVGVYENGALQYTGKIGTGFNDKLQARMIKIFKPLIIKKSSFKITPDINKPSRFRPNPPNAVATWLKPQLVCEVSFLEMTPDGVMRHPSFEGLREDKKAIEVVREKELPAVQVVGENKLLSTKKIIIPMTKKNRKTLLNPGDEMQVRSIERHEIKFTNLSKIFWPKEKITKRDMLNYYYQVVPYMLPYMKDRPQTLNRFPNGINGKSFYQKNVSGTIPGWAHTFPYHSEGDNRDKEFFVCAGEASLLYIAAMGCIEMNPWSSRIQSPDNPDFCIIDLDPDSNSFDKVIEAAQVVKEVLDNIKVSCYCKTSGSTGLHIYIPLGAKYRYEDSKEFARAVVKIVHKKIPRFTSIERLTGKRKGRIYLDFLQNRPQATIAAPYSLRPKPGAPVSAPLHWEEVKKGLRLRDFNIKNMMSRLKSEGDLFKPVLKTGIDINKALQKMIALQKA